MPKLAGAIFGSDCAFSDCAFSDCAFSDCAFSDCAFSERATDLHHYNAKCPSIHFSGKTWLGKKAFSYSNVKLEEESALLGEDETKVGLYRMLKVNSELMELIIKHEFEHLLFPCHLLPMKVSSTQLGVTPWRWK